MAKRNSKNQPKPPVVNVSTTTNVNAWDSAAFSKLLSEQAKANETAIKSLESSMAQAGANQQQLAEQIAQSAMMKDIKEALIAQLQDKQFNEAKQEAIKLKEQEKLKIKEANDALKENLQLRKEEAKAIANIAQGMETFKTMGDRVRDMGKKLKDNFGSMSALKVTALKAFNVAGIFNRSIAKEKFVQTQRKLGSEDDRSTLGDKFNKAERASKDIKENEAELAKFKKDSKMSESQLAGTKEGKRLLDKRAQLSDTYAQNDLRAGLVKKESPTQEHADVGAAEERSIEAEKHAQKQEDLFIKIEQNTRGATPSQGAKPSEGGKEGGLLAGLMSGGAGKALDGMKKFGIGLLAVGAALYVAAEAFKNFGDVDWDSIGKGMVALGGLVLAAIGLDKVKGSIIKGAFALGVLALAMYGMSEALGGFADLDWETIAKGMASVAGIAIIAAVMGSAIVPITLGAAAIGLLGGALWIVGEAMQAVGKGFSEMTEGLEKLGKLDGDNLLKVGAGLAAIGAGMAVFGAGTAAAGIGNLVGGFLNLVTPGKSPVEQIMMMGEKGELIEKAGNGVMNLAKGLSMFSQIDSDKIKVIASLPTEKIAAMGAAMGSASRVDNASRSNADNAATAGGSSGSTSVVNAPVMTNNKTTQIIKPQIRNQESSVSSWLRHKLAT